MPSHFDSHNHTRLLRLTDISWTLTRIFFSFPVQQVLHAGHYSTVHGRPHSLIKLSTSPCQRLCTCDAHWPSPIVLLRECAVSDRRQLARISTLLHSFYTATHLKISYLVPLYSLLSVSYMYFMYLRRPFDNSQYSCCHTWLIQFHAHVRALR
jgi:hypothetical protein